VSGCVISRLEIPDTVSLGTLGIGIKHEATVSGSNSRSAGTYERSNHSSSRRRWRCGRWAHWRPGSWDYRWSRGRWPALLRATTPGLCCSRAGLLLDAWTADLGRLSRSLGFPQRPSLRVGVFRSDRRAARRLGSWLILLGLIGVIASLVWWQNFYSQAIGQPPVECLYQLTGPCRIVSDVAGFFGAAAYDARLLWASCIVGVFGLLLQR